MRITPNYERVRHEETEMTQQRDLCEQKRNEIYAKQVVQILLSDHFDYSFKRFYKYLRVGALGFEQKRSEING